MSLVQNVTVGEEFMVSSIANLKALPATDLRDKRIFTVKEYHTGTGVGGGMFMWDAHSTGADDAGYIIGSNSTANGRFIRQYISVYSNKTVSPCDWGAKPGDSTYDSSVAMNKAISFLNPYTNASFDSAPGGDVILPVGQFYQNNTIYGAPNVRLIGTGGTTGFRFSRAGCAVFIAMPGMDPTKVLLDTAPWLTDSSSRYTVTNSVENGLTLSAGYYGPYIENIVFIGLPDQQCGIRVWRCPDAKLIGVGVYNCKVSFWISGSWGTAVENCFAQGAKYATFLTPHTTALNIVGGYFTGNTAQTFTMGTSQWFHRAMSDSNRPNIAYVTTFLYAHDAVDINMHGVTWEGYYRDFALFYTGNVNIFGGYNENSVIPAGEYGHTVWAHCVASRINAYGVFLNHGFKDFAVQSGNLLSSGAPIQSEISSIKVYQPRVDFKFIQLTKDLGYGSYDILIDSEYPITESLSTTLVAQRSTQVQFLNILDQYTMRQPSIVPNGTTSFSFTISNLIADGEYDVRLIARNASTTVHQDIRFCMLVGGTVSVTGVETRSRTGTAAFGGPTVTYDNAGTATVTFTGNSGNYSVYYVKCVPTQSTPKFLA